MVRTSRGGGGNTAGRSLRAKSDTVNYAEGLVEDQSTYQHTTNVSRSSSRQGGAVPNAYDTNAYPASAVGNGGVPSTYFAGVAAAGTVDPRFLQQQQQQHQQAYVSGRRNSIPHPTNTKDEDEDGDFDAEEDDDDDDEDGEYGAPSRSSTKGKGKGRASSASANGRGRGRGKARGGGASANGKKRSSNAYQMDDDEEEDYVDEDDEGSFKDEDGSEEEELKVPLRNPPRAAAPTIFSHPNFYIPDQTSAPSSNAANATTSRRVNIKFNGKGQASIANQAASAAAFNAPASEADSQITASSDAPHVTSNGVYNYQAQYNAPQGVATSSKPTGKLRIVDSEDEEDAEGESELPSEAPTVTAHNAYGANLRPDDIPAQPEVVVQEYQTNSGRRTLRRTMVESPATSEDEAANKRAKTRGQSKTARKYAGEDSEGEGDYKDEEGGDDDYRATRKARNTRLRTLANKRAGGRGNASKRWDEDDDEDYEEPERSGRRGGAISTESSDGDDEHVVFSDHTSDDDLLLAHRIASGGQGRGKRRSKGGDGAGGDEEDDGRAYGLRRKTKVNYNLPALFGLNPDGTAKAGPSNEGNGASKDKKKKKSGYGGTQHLPFNMSGRQLGSLFGEAPDSSSDEDGATPRRGGTYGGTSGGAMSAGGAGAMDFGFSGTPSNLGKVSGATSKPGFPPPYTVSPLRYFPVLTICVSSRIDLADIDPLLPSTQLSFDSVGGLQGHIQQLKEMVALPLLYPEVFQRFAITPPRGVLFHGPPGTGKTLLARALAASCSSQGQKICKRTCQGSVLD